MPDAPDPRVESWDVEAAAPAKLNLGLEVLARRPDGFHDLRTIFVALDLEDRLWVRARSGGRFTLEVMGDSTVPEGEENLVIRAARALASRLGEGTGADILLEKRIPAGAGLGGGSSDAAATLLALERAWNRSLDPDDRARLALGLGSDVPFFLLGGTCLGEGRGEVLTPWKPPPERVWGVAVLDFPFSTATAFHLLDSGLTQPKSRFSMLLTALGEGDPDGIINNLSNDLEPAVFAREPRLATVRRRLLAGGAPFVAMTGSGSTLFTWLPGPSHPVSSGNPEEGIEEAAAWSRALGPVPHLTTIVPCRVVGRGARVIDPSRIDSG